MRFVPGCCRCELPCTFPLTFCYETEEADPFDLTGTMTYHSTKPSYIPTATPPPLSYPFNAFPSMPWQLYYQQHFNLGFWGLSGTSGWYSCLKPQMKCNYDTTVQWTTGLGPTSTYRWIATDSWYYFFIMPDAYAASGNPDHIGIPYQGIVMQQMVHRTYDLTVYPLVPWGSIERYTGTIWLNGGHLYWALPALTFDYSHELGFTNCGWTDCTVELPDAMIRGHSMAYISNYHAAKICPTINNSQMYWQGVLPYDFQNNFPYWQRGTTSDPLCADHYTIDLFDCSGNSEGLINVPVGCGGVGVGGKATDWVANRVATKPGAGSATGSGGIVLRSDGATAIVEAIGIGSTTITGSGGILVGSIPVDVSITNWKINNIVGSGGVGASGLSINTVEIEEES